MSDAVLDDDSLYLYDSENNELVDSAGDSLAASEKNIEENRSGFGTFIEGRYREPDRIYSKQPAPDGRVLTIIRIFRTVNHTAKLKWELTSSTFLDKNGEPFYDKNGVPFQGKKDE